jgi:hypothetical protein
MRKFGSVLHSKASAEEIRKTCETQLDPTRPLIINMSRVHDISPGFVNECFGPLYLLAKQTNCKMKFEGTKDPLKPIILKGIRDYLYIR